jgi:hypothetical protein
MHERRGGSVASLDCRDRGKLEPRTTFLRHVSQPQHLTHMAMVRYSVNLEVAMRCAPPLAPPDFAWQRAREGPESTYCPVTIRVGMAPLSSLGVISGPY